jgi:hypothetical protein
MFTVLPLAFVRVRSQENVERGLYICNGLTCASYHHVHVHIRSANIDPPICVFPWANWSFCSDVKELRRAGGD